MKKYFVSNILIKRKLNEVDIIVFVAKSDSLFKENFIKDFTDDVSSFINLRFNSRLVLFNIVEISDLDSSSSFIAFFIKEQLEKRVPFRKVIKNAILKVQQSGSFVKGIKVQISGRLNGAEIARTEWVREGQVPLHTIRADIDYSTTTAYTVFGIIGIKVWVYKIK